MELKDTIELMQSADYKDRFRAEYAQADIRIRKLGAFLDKLASGEAQQRYETQQEVLKSQHAVLCTYLEILRVRAKNEGIELPGTKDV